MQQSELVNVMNWLSIPKILNLNRPQGNHLIVGLRFNGKPVGATHEYKVKRGINENGLMYLLFLGVKHYLCEFASIA